MTRALVLSGGGAHGAFQVGALRALAQQGAAYNIFCGVSVGAINAAFLAQYRDLVEGARALEDLWRGISNAKVHRRWFPFGVLHGLWRTGLRDTRPLAELIRRNLSADKILKAGNQLRVGAVSLTSQQYRCFDEGFPDLARAVLASAAFPGAFPAVELAGQQWTDGGVRNMTPLGAAIEAGAREIDVVMASWSFPRKRRVKSAIEVALRALEIALDEILVTDLQLCGARNHLPDHYAQIRLRVIRPSEPLAGGSLDFDPDAIALALEQGYRAAQETA
jgi:NTE family protein